MWQVVVGNIGTVYQGNNQDKATATYHEYVRLSRCNLGRGGGESVVIFRSDGSVLFEYTGSNPTQ
jgi:hypothetical protein